MVLLHILWPGFALAALMLGLWSALLVRRTRGAGGTDAVGVFVLPVLVLGLIPLLMLARQAGVAQVLLAWIFVGVRVGHAAAWLREGEGRRAWRLDLASLAIVSAMWIGFLVDFVRAAVVYQRAIAALLTV